MSLKEDEINTLVALSGLNGKVINRVDVRDDAVEIFLEGGSTLLVQHQPQNLKVYVDQQDVQ